MSTIKITTLSILTLSLLTACNSQPTSTPETPLASKSKTEVIVNDPNQKRLCDYLSPSDIESILGPNFETTGNIHTPDYKDCSLTNTASIENYTILYRKTTKQDAINALNESKTAFEEYLDKNLFSEIQSPDLGDQSYGYTSKLASNLTIIKNDTLLTLAAASNKEIPNVNQKLTQLAQKILNQL